MNTFPFRILVPMDNQSNYPTEFRSQYVSNVTELDFAATKQGLVDTTNPPPGTLTISEWYRSTSR